MSNKNNILSSLNTDYSYEEFFLFQRITQDDEEAFREVVYSYSPKLMSCLFSITKSMHIAEEIVQEVFLRLWQNRKGIEVNNLGGWLYRVGSNLAYSYLKKEALNGRLISSLERKHRSFASEIDMQIDSKEYEKLFHKAISQLPDQQRKVCHMSLWEGMSRKEVADVLKISPNTVKNHLARALQLLRCYFSHIKILVIFFFY